MRLKFQNKIDEIQVDINFYSIIDKVFLGFVTPEKSDASSNVFLSIRQLRSIY